MGRKLQADDQLASGINKKNPLLVPDNKSTEGFSENKDVLLLDCIKSSQFDFFQEKIVKKFTD